MCEHDCQTCPPRRCGLFKTVLSVALIYLAMVFGGGTLINTGHPVAVEVGRLLQLVTFVKPTIGWADHAGYDSLAGGLRMLAHGVALGRVA